MCSFPRTLTANVRISSVRQTSVRRFWSFGCYQKSRTCSQGKSTPYGAAHTRQKQNKGSTSGHTTRKTNTQSFCENRINAPSNRSSRRTMSCGTVLDPLTTGVQQVPPVAMRTHICFTYRFHVFLPTSAIPVNRCRISRVKVGWIVPDGRCGYLKAVSELLSHLLVATTRFFLITASYFRIDFELFFPACLSRFRSSNRELIIQSPGV